MALNIRVLLVLCAAPLLVFAAPAPTKKPDAESAEQPQQAAPNQEPPNTGLYYDQYLQRVVKLLESDENFRKTMEQANFEDIKSGSLSKELYKIPGEIREQLDNAKKEEISRLRRIVYAKMEKEKGRKISQTNYLKQVANHLDHDTPHTFGAEDLTNLIQAATKDLENYDESRHKDFKNYEMNKDLRRQEKLRQMNEQDKKKAEQEYLDLRKKHDNHPDIHHPGSKAQMEEVWQEEDELKDQDFDPRTFFQLRDLNNDGVLDEVELEALFQRDLEKVYDPNNPEDDMMEMEQERAQMRQHVMKEVDKNHDRLIDLEEFLHYTKTTEFGTPDKDSYRSVDDMIDSNEIYSQEDLEAFRAMIDEQEKEIKVKMDNLRLKAKEVVSLKSELYLEEAKMKQKGGGEDHEKEMLEVQKEVVKQEEETLKEMHEDVKEQGKGVLEMKAELQKQENDIKMREGAAVLVPGQEEHAPVQEEHAPVQEEHAPVQEEHAPLQQEHVPVQDQGHEEVKAGEAPRDSNTGNGAQQV